MNLPKIPLFFVWIFCLLFLSPATSAKASSPVYWIQLSDDVISPVTAEYITRSIDKAEEEGAQCLVIELDTPGGLLNSTRTIVKRILSSKVPVVVYIAPSGSRAGSAGVFITYASHIAAMAPSTNIGAAHPVDIGQRQRGNDNFWEGLKELLRSSQEKKESPASVTPKTTPAMSPDTKTEKSDDDPMSSKILNDTVAFIKALAKERNRNVDWAVKSVQQSASIPETEALNSKVIEFIAKDPQELLQKLDGRTVVMRDTTVTLTTKDSPIHKIAMDGRQRFLNILVNPNIAYIFMILGFYGLLFEVTHPGVAAPGILGAIFLILAFFSMQMLPFNYAGLALIILGLSLFAAEVFVPGFGILFVGGSVCMVLGSLLLFQSAEPFMQISLSLIISFTVFSAAMTAFLLSNVLRAHRRKVHGGPEGMIGEAGEASSALSADKEGKVFVHGELWNAVADEPIARGTKVKIVSVDGMTVKVTKK